MNDPYAPGARLSFAAEYRRRRYAHSRRGPGLRLYVRGRDNCNSFTFDGLYTVISVTDPEEPLASLANRPNLLAALRLTFHDFNLKRLPPEKVYRGKALREHAMQPAHADAIWKFVRKHRDQAEAIIIHCEAGFSRSSSIAMAIAKVLKVRRSIDWVDANGTRMRTDTLPRPVNEHVYELLLEHAGKGLQ